LAQATYPPVCGVPYTSDMATRSDRSRDLSKIKSLLGRTAPELARALGGPLAGAATSILARRLLGAEEAAPADLIDVLEPADPETLAKLRLAELDFEGALLEAGVEHARIDAGDRASARAREVSLKDRVPGFLAILVLAGFFGVLAVMMRAGIPEGAATEFSIMLGALATMAASIMNYYFGSSASSREKTHLLEGRRLPLP